jgi:hypothetical protein
MKNGPAPEDILLFIEQRHRQKLGPVAAADVFGALDLDGAAAAEFMADYAREFSVDLAGYEPAFHHRDALRAGRFGWPIAVPHLFGVRLPLPVSTLAQAAQSGRWPVRYPILQPVQGHDWLNWLLVLVALPVLVAFGFALLRAI